MNPPEMLEAGDLVWVDCDPRMGREQSELRLALVVSPSGFWLASRLAIGCPITTKFRPVGSSVVLPKTLGLPVVGEILTSHVRSIDILARPVVATGAAVPPRILVEVRAKLAVLIGFA